MLLLSRFTFKDLIDILIVGFLLYKTYKRMFASGVAVIFLGIVGYIVVWLSMSYVFRFSLTGLLFDRLTELGGFILVVIFHEEIRKYLSEAGKYYWNATKRIFRRKEKAYTMNTGSINALIRACSEMSKTRTGALIAIEQTIHLENIIKSAEPIHAQVGALLLEALFFKNSPLHDGAIHVRGNELISAGGYLPFTRRVDVPQRFGTRHRSALGLSEVSDAKVIVVSEETGAISLAYNGRIFHNLTSSQLETMLLEENINLSNGI